MDKFNRYECRCRPGFRGKRSSQSNISLKILKAKDFFENITYSMALHFTLGSSIFSNDCISFSALTGTNCEENINECANAVCYNGGYCRDGENSYKCLCPIEYTGPNCETEQRPCEGKPCSNNATCNPSSDYRSFTCTCLQGFTGYVSRLITFLAGIGVPTQCIVFYLVWVKHSNSTI